MTNEEASCVLHCPDAYGGIYGQKYGAALAHCFELLKQQPCEDAVSRKWLKNAIHNFYKGLIHTPTEEDIQAYIDVAPSVTPQQKTGHWILYRDHKNMMDYPQCDNCGVIIKLPLPIDNLNYCPNCGAKMGSEGEE